LLFERVGGVVAMELARELVSGMKVVACGISASRGVDLGMTARQTGDPVAHWTVTGSVTDLLEAACAGVLVVPARVDGVTHFFAVSAEEAGVTIGDQPSLDPSQRLGSITLNAAPARLVGSAGDAGLQAAVVERARLLIAAQALGAAQKALNLTSDYAKQRVAFGQPIGRFQAIKHPLADMLVRVENARSAVYHAAWLLDERSSEAPRAVLMAKAVATENAVKVVHQAIQCHGGIGFTWEHDLHLHLRRAKAAELALGRPDDLFDAIGQTLLHPSALSADLAPAAAVSKGAQDSMFYDDFRAWLDENLPEGWGTSDYRMPRGPAERLEFARALQARFALGNWVAIHWPREFGGRGATLAQQVIFNSELVSRGVPQMPGHRGLTIVGPTLIEHGTPEQQERFLERIRSGEDLWAGGFSEPEAGSDLAALRTRAVIEGATVIVNGQKIWTSSAHWCNWIYTLVRTDPDSPKHEGISVVAIPLDSPGVVVRPIRQINGISTFNEVFFEDVRVPIDNIIGPLNQGWTVNRTTLSHEHFTLFIGSQARYRRSLDDIIAMACDRPSMTPSGIAPHLRGRIARAWATSQLIMINGLRNVARVQAGRPPGAAGSIAKVFGQEAEKDLFELALDITGPAGLLDRGADGAVGRGKWLFGYLGARAATIGGGTSEIHKNKIAEGVLGMPRDLWADGADH
jgi:alkylation response protein AidB-like acyl-CoA dehydrogenase